MTMNIEDFRAPQYCARQAPESLRREAQAQIKKTATPPRAIHAKGKLVQFFWHLNNGATLVELMPMARELFASQEVSTSKKVDVLGFLSGKGGADPKDLTLLAEVGNILRIRVVRDTIAATNAHVVAEKYGHARAKMAETGKFVPPAEVVKTEGRPTNIGNPRPKGPSSSKPGQSSNPKTAAKRARTAARRK